MLRWVRQTTISPDGGSIAIGENGKERANTTLYDASTGKLVWETIDGLSDMECVRVAAKGAYTLVATRHESDMEFLLFDKLGKVIWRQKRAKNFEYQPKPYVRFTQNGKGFAIFELKTGTYQSFVLP
jgi:hypothetical protein